MLLLLLVSTIGFSQEILPIRGKIYSSMTRFKPIGVIYIQLEGDDQNYRANNEGEFIIYPKQKQEIYKLTILSGSEELLEYDYKYEWTKRKYPKSILVKAIFPASKEVAKEDHRMDQLQLFIRGPVALSQKDKRFEKKYNVTYYELGDVQRTEDAILDYNKMAIKILRLKYGKIIFKGLRKDVVGL